MATEAQRHRGGWLCFVAGLQSRPGPAYSTLRRRFAAPTKREQPLVSPVRYGLVVETRDVLCDSVTLWQPSFLHSQPETSPKAATDDDSSPPSDHRHRQLLDAGVARAREERLPAAPVEPPRSRRDARRRPQGGDQGSGGRRRRRRHRRRAAARQHDRLLRRAAARRAGRSGVEAVLLRLLRQRRPLEARDRPARPGRRSPLPARVHRPRPKVSISGPHTLVKRIQNATTRRRRRSRSISRGC